MVRNYKTTTVLCEYLGNASGEDLEEFIGKKIARIENEEYVLKIIFEDGSWIKANGSTYGDCALSVDYEFAQSHRNEAL